MNRLLIQIHGFMLEHLMHTTWRMIIARGALVVEITDEARGHESFQGKRFDLFLLTASHLLLAM